MEFTCGHFVGCEWQNREGTTGRTNREAARERREGCCQGWLERAHHSATADRYETERSKARSWHPLLKSSFLFTTMTYIWLYLEKCFDVYDSPLQLHWMLYPTPQINAVGGFLCVLLLVLCSCFLCLLWTTKANGINVDDFTFLWKKQTDECDIIGFTTGHISI